MRKTGYLIFILLFTIFLNITGQTASSNTEQTLGRLFKNLVTAASDTVKIAVNDSIAAIIDKYASSDSVMKHNFTNLKYLGQIRDRNSQLKVISWNLILNEAPGRYYCYFINRSGKELRVRKLIAKYSQDQISTDREYSAKDWYGALYYDLRSYRSDSDYYWVLLGIDYGNPSVTRKIIDILSFRDDGDPVLGRKIFIAGKELKYREVLEYSSEAVISLKFLNDKAIVFDHLVPISPQLKGQKEFYGPDFSYDSYNLDKGLWRYRTNIDVRNKK
jgi:hypothetical protein